MDAWGRRAFFPSPHPSRSDIGACGAGTGAVSTGLSLTWICCQVQTRLNLLLGLQRR